MHHDYTGIGFDQIQYLLNTLKKDPFSRRLILTTFDPSQAPEAVLYPCHGICINFGVDGDNKLNCIMHQRSADEICGIPFNIASYAMLIHVVTELVNNSEDYVGEKLKVGTLTLNMGDMHIYEQDDHISAVKEHLVRTPFKFPEFKFKEKISKLEDMDWEKVEILNYQSHPAIKVKMVA
jgi:thymidylate synthase